MIAEARVRESCVILKLLSLPNPRLWTRIQEGHDDSTLTRRGAR